MPIAWLLWWNGPHFTLQKKPSPFGPGDKKSLSKDGDVIEPQKRCEETWVVANGAKIFYVGQLENNYCKPLVDWEV